MRQRLAKYVSTIGHPLISLPVFTIVVMFMKESTRKAFFISVLIIGGVILPMVVWIMIRTRKGKYSNFDVSERAQRKSLFVFVIPLLGFVTLILFLTEQSLNTCLSVLFALILSVVSQIMNFFIKSSLHVSLTIYLAALVLPMSIGFGSFILLFSFLIGWSRIELGRHTKKEVFAGAIIGVVISASMLFVEGFLTI